MSKPCPTCSGTGSVPDHVADALNRPGDSSIGKVCHCDGPPHTWDPTWCPKDGPR